MARRRATTKMPTTMPMSVSLFGLILNGGNIVERLYYRGGGDAREKGPKRAPKQKKTQGRLPSPASAYGCSYFFKSMIFIPNTTARMTIVDRCGARVLVNTNPRTTPTRSPVKWSDLII